MERASSYLVLLFYALCLLPSVNGQKYDENFCPTSVSNADTAYSPFVPWWAHYTGSSQHCWSWASCVFIRADEARKQQFAATALVMGLIPLTFKDVAWPGRRVILLSKPLNPLLEIIVRAFGMEPKWLTKRDEDKEDLVRGFWLESDLATFTWKWGGIACVVSIVSLLLASGALLVVELHSKRNALGCIYPAFVLSWFAAGFVPAIAHTFFSKVRQHRDERKAKAIFGGNAVAKEDELATIVSAVQGGEEWWVVQLIWATFYIVGTLVVWFPLTLGLL